MKWFVVPVLVLLLLSVSLGAFNYVTGSNNRPLHSFELLESIGDLNLDFSVSIETVTKLKDDLRSFTDKSYRASEEYIQANVFEKFLLEWKNNSVILGILTIGSDIIYCILGFAIDNLIQVIELLSFFQRLIFGVPT